MDELTDRIKIHATNLRATIMRPGGWAWDEVGWNTSIIHRRSPLRHRCASKRCLKPPMSWQEKIVATIRPGNRHQANATDQRPPLRNAALGLVLFYFGSR